MEEKDQENVNNQEEIDDDDFDFEDFEDDDGETSASTDTDKKKQQNREENHEQAKARRERERIKREKEMQDAIEKARKEGYDKAVRETNLANNKVNSFTGQPIKDEYDLKVFELQKKIKEEGGDPINDLASHIAELNRSKETQTKKEQQKVAEGKALIQKQINEFKTTYPDVNYQEVLKEGSPFRNYADGKLGGSKTIAQIYKEYQAFTESIISQNQENVEEAEGKKKSSSPSSSSSKSRGKKSISEMTSDEFYQYWVDKHGSF